MASYPTVTDHTLPAATLAEFENQDAQLEGYLGIEHTPDGTHSDITTKTIIARGEINALETLRLGRNATINYRSDGSRIDIGGVGTQSGNGVQGAGLDIGVQQSATIGRYNLIVTRGTPFTNARGLTFVERGGATPEQPLVLFFNPVTGRYHVSPHGLTNIAIGSDLGDPTQTANGGRWNIYTKHVNFPATPVASSDPSTLDAYLEGSWTPTFTSTGGAGSPTYNTQQGYFVKVGREVTFTCRVSISNKSFLQLGSLLVGGLPYTSHNPHALAYTGVSIGWFSGLLTPVGTLTAYLPPNDTQMRLNYTTAGGSTTTPSLTIADIGNAFDVILGGSYLTQD